MIKNRLQIITFLALVLLLALPALAENPPSLTSFQQFYGTVTDLPSALPILKAKVGNNTYTTALGSEGQFGSAQVFKVFGNSGDTINFYVANFAGLEVPAGTVAFAGGAVTRLELKYNYTASSAASTADTANTTSSSTSSISTSSTSSRTSSTSNLTGTENLSAGQCRQSWECRLWSECVNGQQLRQCYRIDQCDQLQAAGTVNFTISMPKPDEARACQIETAAPTAGTLRICSPNSRRCLGSQLQDCDAEGESWNTLRSCPWGCDSGSSSCRENAPVAPIEQKPASLWIFILVGILAFGLVLGGVFAFLHYKKYAPAKAYVKECQAEGFSDPQIKSKLVSQGWDEDKVEKMLK